MTTSPDAPRRQAAGIASAELDVMCAVLQLVANLLDRPLGEHTTLVDQQEVPGHLLDLRKHVTRNEYRFALVAKSVDQLHHVVAADGIQPIQWLIEQQKLRPGNQRSGELRPLAHSLGVTTDAASHLVGHVEARAVVDEGAVVVSGAVRQAGVGDGDLIELLGPAGAPLRAWARLDASLPEGQTRIDHRAGQILKPGQDGKVQVRRVYQALLR